MTTRIIPTVAFVCVAYPAVAQRTAAAAKVTFLEGTADAVLANASDVMPSRLGEGSSISYSHVVRTEDDSRLELKLADGSVVRLGPRSSLEFPTGERRRASYDLGRGALWWIVSSRSAATPEVQAGHAAVQMRAGTVRVDRHEDGSVLLRVYAGTASVRRNSLAGDPWEKTVGKQMQLLIAPDGTAGVAAPFSEADERDDRWSAWNRKRDEQGK